MLSANSSFTNANVTKSGFINADLADSSPAKCIALVDCNNFYASCERVFNPGWEKKPVCVLSNNDGCIIARSNEVKSAGIPMGAPYFKFRHQLQAINAVVVSSNFALYGDMSARVMHTLAQLAPEIEVYSIDEAWLDLTGLATVDSHARTIAATVRQYTGIPVSIGVAPTKVLAKLANRLCKKQQGSSNALNNVLNLNTIDNLDAVLANFAVDDIWGIGSNLAEKLQQQGIYTAKDLRDSDAVLMRSKYSLIMERIILELRGVPCLEFEDIQAKKQITASRSFGERVTDKNALIEAVAMHASRAAEKLRSQNSLCGAMQISIRTGRHNSNERYYARSVLIQFPLATRDTRKLIAAARTGIERIFVAGHRYAKAGIMLLDIVDEGYQQQSLFTDAATDSAADKKLMRVIDLLNKTQGKKTVFFAAEGIKKTWQMKQDKKTLNFTTDWAEIPIVV